MLYCYATLDISGFVILDKTQVKKPSGSVGKAMCSSKSGLSRLKSRKFYVSRKMAI